MSSPQDQQENPKNWNWQNLFRDKSGKESSKRIIGCLGFIYFSILPLFTTPEMNAVITTGITVSAGLMGVGSITEHG